MAQVIGRADAGKETQVDGRKVPIWTKDFSLVCLTAFSSAMCFQFLLPTLPLYIKSLGGQETEIGLSLAIYSLAALASRMIAGRALDILGRKLPLAIGAFLFFIATPLYALTTAIVPFMLLRLFHGLGFGVVGTGTSALAADLAPAKRRGEALGHFGNANSVAMAVGSAIAVSLMSMSGLPLTGFQLVFAACTLVALVELISAISVRETRKPTKGQSAEKQDWSIGSFFCPAAVPLACAMLFGAVTMGAVMSFVPVYLAVTSTQIVPVFFLVYAVVMTMSRPFVGRLIDRIDRRRVVIPLLVFCSAGVAILAVSPTLPVALASAVVFGLGFGSLMPTLLALLVDRVKAEERGTALATFTAALDIGIAGGAAGFGVVAQNYGFQAVFLGASGVCALGILYFLAVYNRLAPRKQPVSKVTVERSVLPTE